MDQYLPFKCNYNNCNKQYDSSHHLIQHIEATHIDFNVDSKKLQEYLEESDNEEFPTRGIPLSLILPYGNGKNIQEEDILQNNEVSSLELNKLDQQCSDEPDSSTETKKYSKAYWCGPGMVSNKTESQRNDDKQAPKPLKMKKFACTVRGCMKSYKNINGMRYHMMNFHDMNGNFIKPIKHPKEYKCTYCRKEYKTFRGLQSHIQGHQKFQGYQEYQEYKGSQEQDEKQSHILPPSTSNQPETNSFCNPEHSNNPDYLDPDTNSHRYPEDYRFMQRPYKKAMNFNPYSDQTSATHAMNSSNSFKSNADRSVYNYFDYNQTNYPSGYVKKESEFVESNNNGVLSKSIALQYQQLAARNVTHSEIDHQNQEQKQRHVFDNYYVEKSEDVNMNEGSNWGFKRLSNGFNRSFNEGNNGADLVAMNMQLNHLQKQIMNNSVYDRHKMSNQSNDSNQGLRYSAQSSFTLSNRRTFGRSEFQNEINVKEEEDDDFD